MIERYVTSDRLSVELRVLAELCGTGPMGQGADELAERLGGGVEPARVATALVNLRTLGLVEDIEASAVKARPCGMNVSGMIDIAQDRLPALAQSCDASTTRFFLNIVAMLWGKST